VFVEHGHVSMLDLKGKQRTAKTRRRKKVKVSRRHLSASLIAIHSQLNEKEGEEKSYVKHDERANNGMERLVDMEIV
jgi:hypothetical protein